MTEYKKWPQIVLISIFICLWNAVPPWRYGVYLTNLRIWAWLCAFLGQWNLSKHEVSRGLKSACEVKHALSCYFWNQHMKRPGLASWMMRVWERDTHMRSRWHGLYHWIQLSLKQIVPLLSEVKWDNNLLNYLLVFISFIITVFLLYLS